MAVRRWEGLGLRGTLGQGRRGGRQLGALRPPGAAGAWQVPRGPTALALQRLAAKLRLLVANVPQQGRGKGHGFSAVP